MANDGTSPQDARIRDLWKSLDCRRKGQLNFDDLRTSLKDTDHRTPHSRLCVLGSDFTMQLSRMPAAYFTTFSSV